MCFSLHTAGTNMLSCKENSTVATGTPEEEMQLCNCNGEHVQGPDMMGEQPLLLLSRRVK